MRFTTLRYLLAGSASALVLSAHVSFAQESTDETAQTGENPQTLVETNAANQPMMFEEGNVGTALEALIGRSVSEIEGMDVFGEGGERIGEVAMVAESETGAPYLIVSAEQDSATMVAGEHAMPLPMFDYHVEAEGLILRSGYTTAPGTATGTATGTAAGTADWTRIYTVLEGDETIDQVALDDYRRPTETAEAEMTGEGEEMASDDSALDADREPAAGERTADAGVEDPGDARLVLRQENITDLRGRDILSADGEWIASVDEIAYDEQGRLHLIASFGGFLGMGESARAVRLDAFNYAIAEEAFVFTEGGQERLEAMPEWNEDIAGYALIESELDWATFEQTAERSEPATTEAEREPAASGEADAEMTGEAETAGEAEMTGEAETSVEADVTVEAEATGETEDTAEAVEEAAEDTAEAVEEAADETAEAVEEAVDETAAATEEMADETAEATEGMVGDARQVLEREGITDIEGTDVITTEGENVGDVDAVAFSADGELYLIVDLNDGFLGIGGTERPVKLGAFNYSMEEEAFVFLEGGEAKLESLPEWDSDDPNYTVIDSDLDWAQLQ